MEKKKDIAIFFGDYINILNNVDYKIGFLKDLLDKAYLEMTQMLPKISANLKAMVKEIEETVNTLKESGLTEDELGKLNNILEEIKQIPPIILEIMTSLQVQDAVVQCIEHITESVKITHGLISATNTEAFDAKSFCIIKYLKIMPELIVAQLECLYNKMDDSLCYLPKRFQEIFEILRPPITLEELLEGGVEKNKMEILKEELLRIEDNSKNEELKEKLKLAIKKVEGLENNIPRDTNMLDISAAAPRNLQQPLTEIIFLNDNLLKTSRTADDLLHGLYDDDPEKLDCNYLLEKIVVLFSTKDEIEAARTVLKDISIEETGKEGDLELF
jgi:hypothetical protein